MRANAPARPEQSQLPSSYREIINHALREAALAPTVFDALDICGAVMAQLAELCRQEDASHA
ncbi:hypothetical protein EZV77_30110 [Burkholderia thailandensis]|uniref:Uncharacterized protein n=1 Tax=Burkholderia thailandensis TaxID=57975 RepID=A0AAW9CTX7_BURTH|nr:hypothetical protein [Burkholderia thailandensis]MDW9254090.1 hypothetical protein [Burkholderia thailandensis]PJO70049.1 hypothetical protein CWD92_23405 [Burkholderia thailandensis]TBW55310.1 hypothetical protein EZV77_30110 [Burkholderia thailandensis]